MSTKFISQLLYCILYLLGGATEDYDFSGRYTLEANTTKFLFNVSINDDNVFEGNENFTLIINGSWLFMLVEPYQTTVNIIDDDREFLFCKNCIPLFYLSIIV